MVSRLCCTYRFSLNGYRVGLGSDEALGKTFLLLSAQLRRAGAGLSMHSTDNGSGKFAFTDNYNSVLNLNVIEWFTKSTVFYICDTYFFEVIY